MRTLILDFDGSVAPLEGAETISLTARQEEIRFACSPRSLDRLPDFRPADLVFLGSGDFHHVTYTLISRIRRPMQVVVFDNHPDNMRYLFGIHCGSWVARVAKLPFVSRVHVAGISSSDVEGLHAIENHVGLLRSGKVVYWCVRRNLSALRLLGIRESKSFDSTAAMLDGLRETLSDEPVYLSIDKDVLAGEIVQTNWDQGVMRFDELQAAILMLSGEIIAADIVGDVSLYRYRSRFKRMLSAIDRQPEIPAQSLALWREAHRRVNVALRSALEREFQR
jgi:arginase family protein